VRRKTFSPNSVHLSFVVVRKVLRAVVHAKFGGGIRSSEEKIVIESHLRLDGQTAVIERQDLMDSRNAERTCHGDM
jgi:hypothetical protein